MKIGKTIITIRRESGKLLHHEVDDVLREIIGDSTHEIRRLIAHVARSSVKDFVEANGETMLARLDERTRQNLADLDRRTRDNIKALDQTHLKNRDILMAGTTNALNKIASAAGGGVDQVTLAPLNDKLSNGIATLYGPDGTIGRVIDAKLGAMELKTDAGGGS